MKTRHYILAAGAILLAWVAFGLHRAGFVGSSTARVARDHSVSLPLSAAHIRCDGFVAITTFGDFEADASFEIAAQDLPKLLSQFTWDVKAEIEAAKRPNERVFAPVRYAKASASYFGRSRDGNEVWLRTYDLGNVTGVSISTSWN